LPQSYYCKLCMNQWSPEHQQVNRLNNACVKFNLCICIIITSFEFILCIKCNNWHLHCTKSIPKHVYYYVLKIIVHVSFDCSMRVHQSNCTWCGEYFPEWIYALLLRICKILVELHLLNCNLAVALWYNHNFLMINNLC